MIRLDSFLPFFFVFVLPVLAVAEEWLHCTYLDSNREFHVCWNINHGNGLQEIEFMVEVKTHGYVGFGLSPNGAMAGSDLVTGWIKDGQIFLQDRHGKGNFKPEMDTSVDWHLISGSENDTYTTLSFRRKLDTCDKDDIKIDDSTIRLMYAYADEDPESEDEIMYHKYRGSKSVLLLQKGTRNHQVDIDKSSLSYWDILSPNFTIQSEFSSRYWCKVYKAPELTEPNHVILIEPLIQEGNEGFVHHLLLYECVGATSDEYDPQVDHEGFECRHPNMPEALAKCEGVYYAWGVGGDPMVLPEHVGLPLEAGSSKYYMLEMHYDNPYRKDGIIDQSGLRLYYTPKKRKYDAGTIMLGSTVSPRVIVPPGRKDYVVTGHSNPDCTDPEIPEDGLKLLGSFLHAHLLGRHLKARHFRGNKELTPLADDSNYDFNYQDYRYFSNEISFLRGDQISVECTYDSSERNQTTLGGEKTTEEMCIVFLLYYPRILRYASVSVPKLDIINKAINKNYTMEDVFNGEFKNDLELFNWDKTDTFTVERMLRYEDHDTHCYLGNGEKSTVQSAAKYPENLQVLEEKSQCLFTETEKLDFNGCRKQQWGIFILFISLLATFAF